MGSLSEQELGKLLVGLCRMHHTRADQSVERLGLFRGQAYLLMVLARHDGLTHSEIAERLEISAAAATKVIKRMERGDYVERRSDPADERLSRVYLKDSGRAVMARIHAAFGRMDAAMLAGFDDRERECLQDYLARMHSNLTDYQP